MLRFRIPIRAANPIDMPMRKPITVKNCVLKKRSTWPPSQPEPSITMPIAKILESQFKASLAGDNLGMERQFWKGLASHGRHFDKSDFSEVVTVN